jgi:hypothetical protein
MREFKSRPCNLKDEDTSPGSSTLGEHRLHKPEAPGSNPGRGSTYLYALVRKEMTGGALLAQFGHAITECLHPDDLPLPADTRIVVLGATKEQLEGVATLLVKDGVPHKAIVETDGVLEGVITAIGLLTRNREALKPILGELRPYRNPAGAPSPGADNAAAGGRGGRG